MNITNRTAALYFRFFCIFSLTLIVVFSILNLRFVAADIRYSFFSVPTVTLQPTQSPSATQKPLPDVANLVIPKLGVNAPLVFNIPSDNKKIFAQLENGVVHYSVTPKPGKNGAAIVLGHSSAYPWYKGQYGSVFALLGKLQIGDQLQVAYADGQTFTFAMTRAVIFNPFGNGSELAALQQTQKPSIILISCWPVGTSYRRIAVQAELVP